MEITHIFFLQDSTITEVYTNACKGVASLKEIYLPSSVRIIQDSAFEDAYNLKNAHLNNDITTIGNNAFKNSTEHDSALVLMELPTGLTTLGSHAFACTGTGNFTAPGIKIDTLPIGITKLNSFTFNKCPNVAILNWGTNNIGEGLKVIGERALEECGGIALQNKTINILPSV
jgi:hypothetical protein